MPTEHDLRRHRHHRHAGPEAEQQAAEDEQDRVGDPQRAREDEQRGARHEQHQQLQLLPRAELEDQLGADVAAAAEYPTASLGACATPAAA